jgi:hypothetical protein
MVSRLPLASWRLFLASCATFGLGNAATSLDLWWEGLGVQACVAVMLVHFTLAWVGLVRPATSAWSLLVNGAVPVLVTADYLLVGRTAGRWWWPVTWALLPLLYLVYYAGAGLEFYDFLDPFGTYYQLAVLGFLLAAAAIGFVLFGLAGGRQSTYDHDISLSGR